jgi:hypothetical protein
MTQNKLDVHRGALSGVQHHARHTARDEYETHPHLSVISTAAPWRISDTIVSLSACSAAHINAVMLKATRLRCLGSYVVHTYLRTCERACAKVRPAQRETHPKPSCALTSAPLCKSRETISLWPSTTAITSGMSLRRTEVKQSKRHAHGATYPLSFRASMSARASRRACGGKSKSAVARACYEPCTVLSMQAVHGQRERACTRILVFLCSSVFSGTPRPPPAHLPPLL